MSFRIPNTDSPSEVRQAFQRLNSRVSSIDISDDTNLAVVSPIVLTDDTLSLDQGAVDHGSIGGLSDDDHAQYHNDARGDVRYYTETELDAGQLDSRYYTETELDAGQLDNRYYTETEIDAGYYTKTELDAGQLDNRYYTETEIDAAYGPYEAEADIDVVVGQPLYIKSNAHVALAAADAEDTSKVIGLSTEVTGSGNTAKYNVDGKLYIADWTAVVGSALLTPGTDYYLAVSAAASGTPAYGNAGGTGNRTSIITVSTDISTVGALTELIEGAFQDGTFWFSANTAITGEYLRFDFGSGVSKIITEAKWYQGTAPNTQGVWQWQGSDNASDWTDIGGTFTLGGAGTQTQTELVANSVGYRYYQLFGISGNAGPFPTYIREIEFKIDDYTPPVGDGELTATAPSSTGEYVVRVGRAISTTVLDIEIERPILL